MAGVTRPLYRATFLRVLLPTGLAQDEVRGPPARGSETGASTRRSEDVSTEETPSVLRLVPLTRSRSPLTRVEVDGPTRLGETRLRVGGWGPPRLVVSVPVYLGSDRRLLIYPTTYYQTPVSVGGHSETPEDH